MEEIFRVNEAELFLRHWRDALHLQLEVVAVQVRLVVLSVSTLHSEKFRVTNQ